MENTATNSGVGLIFLGVIASIIVLFAYSSSGTLTRPQTAPRTLSKTDNVQFIYRGVPIGHPGYDYALDGIAKPIGGHNSPWLHRDGETNSNFTSWTTNLSIAYRFATHGLKGKCNGVILVKKANLNSDRIVDMQKEPGGDAYNEKEILIKGMMNGAIPVLVTSGTNHLDLVNQIKNAL